MTDPSAPQLVQGVLFDLYTDHVQRKTPENQHLHFLAIAKITGVGPATLRGLYNEFPVLGDVWDADEDALRDALKRARVGAAERIARTILAGRDAALTEADNELTELTSRGIRLLLDSDPEFPSRLREIPSPPRWLFVQGSTDLLNRTSSVAVVGTREATPTGMNLTRQLCELLVRWGYVVVSGLAEGIDTAAHRTTVDLKGETVAVLGTGINIEFPAGSSPLRERILQRGGTIVTEYFPDALYSKQSFVQRNRIQAGLASVVIPVESRARSGTAHTVRFAEEFRRELIAVWNSRYPNDQMSEITMILRTHGYPMCDLSSERGRAELKTLLSTFGTDTIPREVDDQTIWRSAYGSALRALHAAAQARPVDPAAAEWIIETARRIVTDNDVERPDGDQGGLFRP